jgi:hypothetical protein
VGPACHLNLDIPWAHVDLVQASAHLLHKHGLAFNQGLMEQGVVQCAAIVTITVGHSSQGPALICLKLTEAELARLFSRTLPNLCLGVMSLNASQFKGGCLSAQPFSVTQGSFHEASRSHFLGGGKWTLLPSLGLLSSWAAITQALWLTEFPCLCLVPCWSTNKDWCSLAYMGIGFGSCSHSLFATSVVACSSLRSTKVEKLLPWLSE